MFLALNASVELYKGGIVPLSEYAQRPYDRDILVRVIVPKEQAAFCYQSVRNLSLIHICGCFPCRYRCRLDDR